MGGSGYLPMRVAGRSAEPAVQVGVAAGNSHARACLGLLDIVSIHGVGEGGECVCEWVVGKTAGECASIHTAWVLGEVVYYHDGDVFVGGVVRGCSCSVRGMVVVWWVGCGWCYGCGDGSIWRYGHSHCTRSRWGGVAGWVVWGWRARSLFFR